jgi:hypothetical protein
MSGAIHGRLSRGSEYTQRSAEAHTSSPLFGSTIFSASPYIFGLAPVGSPTHSVLVCFSRSSVSIIAAEIELSPRHGVKQVHMALRQLFGQEIEILAPGMPIVFNMHHYNS